MQWQANWIWIDGRADAPHTTVITRKRINLKTRPRFAAVDVSAGQIYRLYVNGQYVGRGPCRADPRWPYYDTYDLAPLLDAGDNDVVAVVHHNRKPGDDTPQRVWCLYDGDGGFAAQINLDGQQVVTDDSWQIALTPGYDQDHTQQPHKFHPYKHVLDVSAFSRAMDALDDVDWQKPIVQDGVLGEPIAPEQPPLVRTPRQPRYMGEVQSEAQIVDGPRHLMLGHPDQRPGASAGVDGAEHTVDWGRPMGGFPVITFEAEGDAEIDLYYGEGAVFLHSDRLTLSKGTWTYEPLDWRGGQYMTIRYRSASAPVRLAEVRFDEMVYPFDPVGSFSCSDDTLTRTWDICRETVWVGVKDHPVDCVWREQALWLSDLYIHECAIRACFGDLTPLAKGIRQALRTEQDGIVSVPGPAGLGYERNNPNSLNWSEQPMTLTMTIAEHCRFTGDATLAEETIPNVERMMAHFARYEEDRGLLDLTHKGLPALTGFGGWNPKLNKGVTSGYNFGYVLSLEAAANIARLAGRDDLAETWRGKASHIRDTVRELFWDDGRKLYQFGEHDGKRYEAFGLTSNSLAAMAGGVPHADRGSFVEALRNDPAVHPIVSPMDASMLLMALVKLDMELHVREVLDAYYGSIIRANQPTVPEFWSAADGTGAGLRGDASRCHPYGTGPAYICHDYILGVRATRPGYGDVVIRPRACGLTEAHGRVPTPHGPIGVAWRRKDYSWHVEVDLPENVTAAVTLPLASFNRHTLRVDNQVVAMDDHWHDLAKQLTTQYVSSDPRDVSHRFDSPGRHTVTLESY